MGYEDIQIPEDEVKGLITKEQPKDDPKDTPGEPGKDDPAGPVKVKVGEEVVELTPEEIANLYEDQKNNSEWKAANTKRSQELAEEKRALAEQAAKAKVIIDKFNSLKELDNDSREDLKEILGFDPLEVSNDEIEAVLGTKEPEEKPSDLEGTVKAIQERIARREAIEEAERVRETGGKMLGRELNDDDMTKVVEFAVQNGTNLDVAFKSVFFDEVAKITKVKDGIPTASGGTPLSGDFDLPDAPVESYDDAERAALAVIR